MSSNLLRLEPLKAVLSHGLQLLLYNYTLKLVLVFG